MKREDLKKIIPSISDKQADELIKAFDADCKEQISKMQEGYKKAEFERRLNEELLKAASKNVKALKALLDISKISLENGEMKGLSEQIENIKKDNGFLFENEEKKPQFTSPNAGSTSVSGKEFEKMSYKKRLKLFRENPELYKALSLR